MGRSRHEPESIVETHYSWETKQTDKQTKLYGDKGGQEYVGDPAFYGETGTVLKATFPISRFTYPPKTEAKSIHQRMFPSLLPPPC